METHIEELNNNSSVTDSDDDEIEVDELIIIFDAKSHGAKTIGELRPQG